MATHAAQSKAPLGARHGVDPVHSSPPAADERGRAARLGIFIYGVLAYAIFLATFLYAIGFVGNWFVPKSIDTGAASPLASALLINGALLGLFAVQHTIMARPAFKRWFRRFVPGPAERSTFVLSASLILLLTFWQWRPLPSIVWDVEASWARMLLSGVSLAGWGVVLLSTFLINHFDLFGLRQVWLALRGREYQPVRFQVRSLYRHVRHPLMTGFIIAFWATPTMTVGHLFFAGMTTAYILVGIAFEERDLIAHFGDRYREYRRQVPALVPTLWRRG